MNLQKMMQQAQAMQGKIAEAQAKLEGETYEGQAGGGMVKASINGKGHALSITIDESLAAPGEKETLEDLLVVAFNNARSGMESNFSDAMGKVTAGLPLPPGFKLPF